MKVKHKYSGEIIDLDEPNYGKHYASIYGYLVANNNKVFFIYSIDNELFCENVSEDYEILNNKEYNYVQKYL